MRCLPPQWSDHVAPTLKKVVTENRIRSTRVGGDSHYHSRWQAPRLRSAQSSNCRLWHWRRCQPLPGCTEVMRLRAALLRCLTKSRTGTQDSHPQSGHGPITRAEGQGQTAKRLEGACWKSPWWQQCTWQWDAAPRSGHQRNHPKLRWSAAFESWCRSAHPRLGFCFLAHKQWRHRF